VVFPGVFQRFGGENQLFSPPIGTLVALEDFIWVIYGKSPGFLEGST